MKIRLLIAVVSFLLMPLLAHAFTPEGGWYLQLTSDNDAGKGGTGLGIEIQNEYMFAAGFLYTSGGQPTWVALQGQLTKQSDGSWGLEDDDGLYTGKNGQCLGTLAECPYKGSTLVPVGGFKINFPAENLGTMTWGPTGHQSTVVIERFVYNLGNGPQSLIGRWDVLLNHQGAANGDGIQYEGDRLRFTSVSPSGSNYSIGGCVENGSEASTQTCAPNKANVFGVTGSATGEFFGHAYQVLVYNAPSNGTPKIIRVYSFSEPGLGGAFSGTMHGTANLCGAGVTSASACTTVTNVPFTAYRSGSSNYATTGNGMDQELND